MNRKLIILTIGYGQGHCAAAAALEEEFCERGWHVSVVDPCEADRSGLYALTKMYYRLCVRRAPWLWGVTYARTDTSDWSSKMRWPGLRTVVDYVHRLIVAECPDFVLCTYPVYGYMLDYLRRERGCHVQYGMVITDAIEISKPWLHAEAGTLYAPDEYSVDLIRTRYALKAKRILAAGFPVRKSFIPAASTDIPNRDNLRVVYGVYLDVHETVNQIRILLSHYPYIRMTVLAGKRSFGVSKALCDYIRDGRVEVLESCERMAQLFRQSHLYIGKTGAATMFEAYAVGIPFVANFALPGQEQGNLALLLRDEVGVWVESARQLLDAVDSLLADGAALWLRMRKRMLSLRKRIVGAEVVADDVEKQLDI